MRRCVCQWTRVCSESTVCLRGSVKLRANRLCADDAAGVWLFVCTHTARRARGRLCMVVQACASTGAVDGATDLVVACGAGSGQQLEATQACHQCPSRAPLSVRRDDGGLPANRGHSRPPRCAGVAPAAALVSMLACLRLLTRLLTRVAPGGSASGEGCCARPASPAAGWPSTPAACTSSSASAQLRSSARCCSALARSASAFACERERSARSAHATRCGAGGASQTRRTGSASSSCCSSSSADSARCRYADSAAWRRCQAGSPAGPPATPEGVCSAVLAGPHDGAPPLPGNANCASGAVATGVAGTVRFSDAVWPEQRKAGRRRSAPQRRGARGTSAPLPDAAQQGRCSRTARTAAVQPRTCSVAQAGSLPAVAGRGWRFTQRPAAVHGRLLQRQPAGKLHPAALRGAIKRKRAPDGRCKLSTASEGTGGETEGHNCTVLRARIGPPAACSGYGGLRRSSFRASQRARRAATAAVLLPQLLAASAASLAARSALQSTPLATGQHPAALRPRPPPQARRRRSRRRCCTLSCRATAEWRRSWCSRRVRA